MAASTSIPRTTCEILSGLGEPFAAGFMCNPDAAMVERFANGLCTWARALSLPPYRGELLYPTGPSYWNRNDMAAGWYYVGGTPLHRDAFDRKIANADSAEREALLELKEVWEAHVFPGGYTHSIPHYERVLAEGLDGFARRVGDGLDGSEGDSERAGFFRAMETTLDAARILRRRMIDEIERCATRDEREELNKQALLDAYHRAPFSPADGFFEAAVATNFIFYFDGCDDLGRYDQYLFPYYERSIVTGDITRDDALELVRAQWRNVDNATAWNAAIGGVMPDTGDDLSNELTVICIEAARNMRRPNLALRLGPATPDAVWDAALDTIQTGCGLPALYWDPNYYHAMEVSGVPVHAEDRHEYAFGGCTELMVQGRSFVGSLDESINLPEVLARTVDVHLRSSGDFESLYAAYRRDLSTEIERLTSSVNQWQQEKATWQPQPIRSLLIDDCLDTGREYCAGGARYNWSVINVMGLANAVDSLSAIKEAVYDSGAVLAECVIEALKADFADYSTVLNRLRQAPKYGNGDPHADELARDLSEFVFAEFLSRRTWRGGGPFVPSCLMFTTYAYFGTMVGATADGRKSGEPIADSAGPHQGRDTSGPTNMLRSVAGIDQEHAPGTLVVNIRLGAQHFESEEQREKTRALIQGYFDMGGLQLQVNTVDQAVLRDALEHPDRHRNLVVRIGGYSEYWTNLTPELRESVLLRTEH